METLSLEDHSRAVLVTNVSPSSTEKTVSDFFSFCGKISRLYLSRQNDVVSVVVVFETESAAKTALLLTNALIGDRPITVSPYGLYPNLSTPTAPAGVPGMQEAEASNITQRDFGDVNDDQRTKTSVVASLIAAGYSLGMDALAKAQEIDQKTRFQDKAKGAYDNMVAKAHQIDEEYKISDKAKTAALTAQGKVTAVANSIATNPTVVAAVGTVKATTQSVVTKVTANPTVNAAISTAQTTAASVTTKIETKYQEIKQETQRAIDQKKEERAQKAGTAGAPAPSATPPSTPAPSAEANSASPAPQQ